MKTHEIGDIARRVDNRAKVKAYANFIRTVAGIQPNLVAQATPDELRGLLRSIIGTAGALVVK